jgi:Fe-S cluster assembly protein SufD
MADHSLKLSSIKDLVACWDTVATRYGDIGRQAKERRRRFLDDAVNDGMPNTRHEEWKYTSLRTLLDRSFEIGPKLSPRDPKLLTEISKGVVEHLIPGANPVVFVDGEYINSLPGLSPMDHKSVFVLAEIEKREDASWWDQWLLSLDSSRVFWKLCFGVSTEGVVIKIPSNQPETQLFQVIHLRTGKNNDCASNNRVLIEVGDGSSVRVVEDYVGLDCSTDEVNGPWTNSVTQIRLGARAHCGYYRLVDSPGAFHTGGVSVHLDKSSTLDALSLVVSGRLVRVDVDVTHSARDSECQLNGLTLARGKDHIDHHTSVDHRVGATLTRQLFKGILDDASRLVFNGKIFIRKEAQKTEAYQTCKNLLLSQEAEANAKPQLEIDADDVKASHGAAIGSVDPQELFYLQSRCIDKNTALAVLCRGFADDVILKIKDEQIRNVLLTRVGEWFQQKTTQLLEAKQP